MNWNVFLFPPYFTCKLTYQQKLILGFALILPFLLRSSSSFRIFIILLLQVLMYYCFDYPCQPIKLRTQKMKKTKKKSTFRSKKLENNCNYFIFMDDLNSIFPSVIIAMRQHFLLHFEMGSYFCSTQFQLLFFGLLLALIPYRKHN